MLIKSYKFIIVLCCLYCLLGCGGKEKQPNIILISIDTLRQDHVSCYGYHRETTPTLDKLAREGSRFEACVTPAPWTLPAHMSVMTGLPPSLHQVQEKKEILPDNIITLAQILKKHKYQTYGLATSAFLKKIYGFHRGFDYYKVMPNKTAKMVTKKALKWLSQDKIKNDRFFLFLHYYDVHWPFHPPDKFISLFGASSEDLKYGDFEFLKQFSSPKKPLDPEIKKKIIALYDAGIRYTDKQINKIVRFLEKNKILDNTIIVIFSDHGEEFKEHNSFGHGHSFYKEVIDVPLVIRYPPKIKANTIISQPVITSDIPLTLLKMANIEPPQQFCLNSVDLLAHMKKKTKRTYAGRSFFLESTRRGPKRVAVLKRNFKYIPSYVYNAYRSGKEEKKKWFFIPEGLYNCAQDPYEKVNILQNHQQETSLLKAEVKKYIHNNIPALQLSFIPSPNEIDEYKGTVTFDSKLEDEPYGLGIDESDLISPLKLTENIRFSLEVDDKRKSLLFPLSSMIKQVTLKIYRNQNLLYNNTINLPNPGEEILLGAKNLGYGGGCLLKRSTFSLKMKRDKAKMTKEQIKQLESLGYL